MGNHNSHKPQLGHLLLSSFYWGLFLCNHWLIGEISFLTISLTSYGLGAVFRCLDEKRAQSNLSVRPFCQWTVEPCNASLRALLFFLSIEYAIVQLKYYRLFRQLTT